jgi:hypothetical protein
LECRNLIDVQDVATEACMSSAVVLCTFYLHLMITFGKHFIYSRRSYKTHREEQAEEYLDKALAIRQRFLGLHHPLTLDSVSLRAVVSFKYQCLPI